MYSESSKPLYNVVLFLMLYSLVMNHGYIRMEC